MAPHTKDSNINANGTPKEIGILSRPLHGAINRSSVTAPANSPRRMALMIAGRGEENESQRASDDSRLDEIRGPRTPKPVINGTVNNLANGHAHPEPMLTGFAWIQGTRFKGMPVYSISHFDDKRLVLRSIGTPHSEIQVIRDNAHFNGINLKHFDIQTIMKEGDHVLVKPASLGEWYDGRTGKLGRQATSIHFPRQTDGTLPKGQRWIVEGVVYKDSYNLNGVMINTRIKRNLESDIDSDTIKIRASPRSLTKGKPEPDSSVMVRAALTGEASEAWSKQATDYDTPWECESVYVMGGEVGICKGTGCLILDHPYDKINGPYFICAPKFGYVYVPNELIKEAMRNGITVQVDKKGKKVLDFEACYNIIGEDEKNNKYIAKSRWRATVVKQWKKKVRFATNTPESDDYEVLPPEVVITCLDNEPASPSVKGEDTLEDAEKTDSLITDPQIFDVQQESGTTVSNPMIKAEPIEPCPSCQLICTC